MADETDLAEERNRSNVGANGGASAETRGEEGVAGAHGRSDDGQDGCEEPARLCCPVTQIMFRDPVFVPDSGNTYERQALETFWRAQSRAGAPPRDPLNNTVLATTQVFPNWDKRREVNAWLQAHPDYVPIGWASRDDIPPAATHGQNGRPFEAGGLHRHDGRGVHVELNLHIQLISRRACIFVVVVASLLFGSSLHELAYMDVGDHSMASTSAAVLQAEKRGLRGHSWARRRAPAGSRLKLAVIPDSTTAHCPSHSKAEGSLGDGACQASGETLAVFVPELAWRELPLLDVLSALFVLGFVGMWTRAASAPDAPVFLALFSAPFWYTGGMLLRGAVLPHIQATSLHLKAGGLSMRTRVLGRYTSAGAVGWRGLSNLQVETKMVVNGQPKCVLSVEEGLQVHEWGASVLQCNEIDYIHEQLVAYVSDRARHRRVSSGGRGASAATWDIDPQLLHKLRSPSAQRRGNAV